MKSILLALALLQGDAQWQDETTYSGLVCSSREAASIVANTPVSYMLDNHIERAGCQTVYGLEGVIVSETEAFGIGNTLHTFLTIRTTDGDVYLLVPLGEGYTA